MRAEDVMNALDIAIICHKGQLRKGTKIPYIKHIIDVYEILREQNLRNEVLIIGILHDTIEDTNLNLYEVRAMFGDYVADGVAIESEDKTIKDYDERKKEHLDRVIQSSPEIQMVNCADKLANLRDMINDYNEKGEDLFKRFRNGKYGVLKYYNYAVKNYTIKDSPIYQMFRIEFKEFLKQIENGLTKDVIV